ncbi:unnamed protein product, partial [Prorocentrum cordatum]
AGPAGRARASRAAGPRALAAPPGPAAVRAGAWAAPVWRAPAGAERGGAAEAGARPSGAPGGGPFGSTSSGDACWPDSIRTPPCAAGAPAAATQAVSPPPSSGDPARRVALEGGGLSGVTTVRLKNLDLALSSKELARVLNDHGFKDSCDMIYVPLDAKKRANNRSIAFVNFRESSAAEAFYQRFHNQDMPGAGVPGKSLEVTPAYVQGFEENILKGTHICTTIHFRRSARIPWIGAGALWPRLCRPPWRASRAMEVVSERRSNSAARSESVCLCSGLFLGRRSSLALPGPDAELHPLPVLSRASSAGSLHLALAAAAAPLERPGGGLAARTAFKRKRQRGRPSSARVRTTYVESRARGFQASLIVRGALRHPSSTTPPRRC